MIRMLSRALAIAGISLAMASQAGAQPAIASDRPDDFALTISSRPTHLYDPIDVMRAEVRADGTVEVKDFRYAGEGGEIRAGISVQFSPADLDRLWQQVMAADFFNRPAEIVNYSISGGDMAIFEVVANGRRHSVRTVNIGVPELDALAASVNGRLPASHRLFYNALFYPELLVPPEERP